MMSRDSEKLNRHEFSRDSTTYATAPTKYMPNPSNPANETDLDKGVKGWVLVSGAQRYSQASYDGEIAKGILTFVDVILSSSSLSYQASYATSVFSVIKDILLEHDNWREGPRADIPGSYRHYKLNTAGVYSDADAANGLSAVYPISYTAPVLSAGLLLSKYDKNLPGQTFTSRSNKFNSFWKLFISADGNGYRWNYSPVDNTLTNPDTTKYIEDIYAGSSDIHYAILSQKLGVGSQKFLTSDMQEFAKTFKNKFVNSTDNIYCTIDNLLSQNSTSYTTQYCALVAMTDWLDLVEYDPTLFPVVLGLYQRWNSTYTTTATHDPNVLYGLSNLMYWKARGY